MALGVPSWVRERTQEINRKVTYTTNPRYNGPIRGNRGSVIAVGRYNRVKGYSREYATVYIANIRNKHGNT
jgi:hypothetical protein